MHGPCHSSKVLNIFIKIVQILGVFTQNKTNPQNPKRVSKQSCGFLVKPYALIVKNLYVLKSEQHNCCGKICILHLVFLYHKKENYLMGAPWQEPEATNEMKIILKISAQRYGQVSLSTI